jgi:beta-glucanase (GH16 family)
MKALLGVLERVSAARHTTISGIAVVLGGVFFGLFASHGLAAIPSTEAARFSSAPSWSDEFSGSSLDMSKWQYGLGPVRAGICTTDAVSVGGGNMTITTYSVNNGGTLEHHTGYLSQEPFGQKYGYFETRMKATVSSGQRSSYWMMPAVGSSGFWTEMDFELFGYMPNTANLAVIWDGYGADMKISSTVVNVPSVSSFHTYGLAWDPSGYRYYIDNVLRWSCADALAQVPERVLLTSEVSSSDWEGGIPTGGYGSFGSSSNPKFTVDYVRIYSLVPEPSSVVLLGIGAISLLGYTWRRRRARPVRLGVSLLLGCALVAVCLGGCRGDRGPERVVVSGKVTYQGKPLPQGMIRFVPAQTSTGPTAGASIVDGNYSVDSHGGVPVGTHTVQIEGYRKMQTAPPPGRPMAPGGDPQEQYLPNKFNMNTGLQITIPSGSGAITKNVDLVD